jgi:Domain of unknown function (DUF222)
MCDRAGEDQGQMDEIGALAVATDRVRCRSRSTAPVALRNDLTRLRRIIDRIELEFSTVAGTFANTEEEEWQGCLSPPHWMRLECGMTSAAATSAVAVGSQADALAESIAAVEVGKIGFAHLALMAGTARAFQASPTATPFEEQPLLDQALSHSLSRFRNDCAHARHAHDAQAFQAEQLREVEYRTLEVRTGEGGAVFIKGFLDPVGGATLCTALDPLARSSGSDDDRPRPRRYADRSWNSRGTASTLRSYPVWVVNVRTCKSPPALTHWSEPLVLPPGCSSGPGRSVRPPCNASHATPA